MNTQCDNYLKFMDNRTLALCGAIKTINKMVKRVKHSDERELLIKLIDAKLNLAIILETHLMQFGGNTYGYPEPIAS